MGWGSDADRIAHEAQIERERLKRDAEREASRTREEQQRILEEERRRREGRSR